MSDLLAAQEVFAYWQERMGKQRSRLDDKRLSCIKARLREGYSVGDLKEAIDGCRQSNWHQGRNDRNKVYNDIELICRDAKHVDEFIEECTKWRKLEDQKKAEAERKRREEAQLAVERAQRVQRGPSLPPWRKPRPGSS
jgi:uncharacterized phage protein (TIGR02220 family)